MTINVDVTARRSLLIEQYRESPRLNAVIDGLLTILQEQLVAPACAVASYQTPDTATGVWLDYLGQRLGFNRPLVIADADLNFFGFNGAGVGFDQASFHDPETIASSRTPAGDTWYRRMLGARAIFLRGGASLETIEAVAAILFDAATITETDFAIAIEATTASAKYFDAVAASRTALIPIPAGVALTLTRA